MKRKEIKKDGIHSMRKLILRAMFFCVLLFLIVALVGFFSISNSYYTEFARNQEELLKSYYHCLDQYMSNVARLSLQIIADESVQKGLSEIMNASGSRLAQGRTSLQNAVASSVASVSTYGYISSVVVSDSDGYLYSYGSIPQNAQLQASLRELIRKTDASGREKWYTLEWADQTFLVLCRAIRETKNLSLNILGYETILINFQNMLERADSGDHTYAESLETFLDGSRFYRGSLCPELNNSMETYSASETGSEWKIISVNGVRYFVSSAVFLSGRLSFISYVDYSRLTGVLHHAWQNQLWLLALLILFCVAFFELVVRRIFRHLEALTEAVRQTPVEDFRIALSPEMLQSQDEVGILAAQFQHLLDRIDNLIHQELQGQLMAARARCRMLQAQIHPHFLYNTLETIYALSEREGNRDVSRITMSLSRLVRASFRDSIYGTLGEEITLIREYLSIYRTRFGARLSAVIDYDPDDDDLCLPRLTLQPLVENSIRYGLMKKLDAGVIRLRIRHAGGQLRISLFDNGIGFTPAQLEACNHLQPDDDLNIHGYQNVIFRLQYAYGDQLSYRLRSREGQWTNLSMIIPDRIPAESPYSAAAAKTKGGEA